MSEMPNRWSEVRQGIADFIPILIAVLPVGAMFGTLAVGAGLTPFEAVLMSLTMYAGASQMVAIDLWGAHVPAWSILLSVLAVNFRHILYSAAMTKIVSRHRPLTRAAMLFFLVDPTYAVSANREARGERVTLAYYFGGAAVCYATWAASTFVGAAFGKLIANPHALAIDMILPIYFLSLLLGFRARARWGRVVLASAVVSSLVYHAPALGIPWLGSPWHISLGAAAGILAAVIGPQTPVATGRRNLLRRPRLRRRPRVSAPKVEPGAVA